METTVLQSRTKSERPKYRKSILERSDWDTGGDDRDCGSSIYRELASQSIEQGLSCHEPPSGVTPITILAAEGLYVPG